MDSGNNWIDNNSDQIQYYLTSQDKILIERKRCIDILLQLFSYRFDKKNGLRILDLGCGDGILTQIINDRFPGNNFTVLDGSQTMINKAKERLKSINVTFLEMSFDEYIAEPINDGRFDFAFSSMAIHHLPVLQKTRLYEKIYHELSFEGLFLNIDVVLPESAKSEQWQFNLWRDWILEGKSTQNDEDNFERHSNLPNEYKNKSENKPSRLFDQLSALRNVGFIDVDCYYKYGIFSLFGGCKY
jgi:tRNA (cmo5U34)-methyltransferase